MADNRHHGSERDHDVFLPDLTNPEQRHEARDINAFAVGKFAIGLVIVTIFCIGLMAGLFQYFLHREGGAPPSRLESPAQDARQLPPDPRLEVTESSDLQEMHAAEDKILGSYGWIDQQAGIVRLPIDRAMDLLAQRGLPARAENGPQSAAAGVSVPTQSSLGPKMQQIGGPLAPELHPGAIQQEGVGK